MPVLRGHQDSRTRDASPEGEGPRTRGAGADSPASETPAADAPPTEAEILLGVAMWLAAARDWFDEEATLARGRLGLDVGDTAGEGASVTMKLSDVERLLEGMRGAVGCLDRLTIDPTRIRALIESAPLPSEHQGTLQ